MFHALGLLALAQQGMEPNFTDLFRQSPWPIPKLPALPQREPDFGGFGAFTSQEAPSQVKFLVASLTFSLTVHHAVLVVVLPRRSHPCIFYTPAALLFRTRTPRSVPSARQLLQNRRAPPLTRKGTDPRAPAPRPLASKLWLRRLCHCLMSALVISPPP